MILLILSASGLPGSPGYSQAPQALEHNLMPVPASLEFGDGHLVVDTTFRVALTSYSEPRLERAIARLVDRLARQTGIPVGVGQAADRPITLEVQCGAGAEPVQSMREDESYSLVVTAEGAVLRAPSPYGVLRGIETLLQLVEPGADGFQVPEVRIEDHPRFPWRGLLIDVARHWMPPEVIKRNLDGMAAVKLNVLHWHLTEDQGFRVESKLFPKLHQLGSDGNYYTQEEIREIVAYAYDRGIRVVPEFDMPGHTTSWFVGHPEIASMPGPYSIERQRGVMDPSMDPTRDEVYQFLDRFIGEMVELFPDLYFHIGGDEVTGKHWAESAEIQSFMRQQALDDQHALQVHFNRGILEILTRYGRRMVGWDEIFQPDLPQNIVIQSWRGQESLAESARRGYQGILSNGYYLDHMRPASFHYLVDPLGTRAAELSEPERARVLGGEACMWAEWVTPETIDSRIWPRTAAIAERYWSSSEVNDLADMYRRLDATSQWLDWLGLTHRSGYPRMLRRLAGGRPIESLQVLTDVLEPVKGYARGRNAAYSTLMPLNRLVDAARPESDRARVFRELVDGLLAGEAGEAGEAVAEWQGGRVGEIAKWLTFWRENHARLQSLIAEEPMLREVEPLAWNLRQAAELGLQALEQLNAGTPTPERDRAAQLEVMEEIEKPYADLQIMIAPAIRKLVEAAHASGGS